MPRLEEIEDPLKTLLAGLPCPTFATTPAVAGPALRHRQVAIVSTAGLHLRTAPPFLGLSAEYRELPFSAQPGDIVMSHVSPNFDRSGFQMDWNVAFPLDRLKELVREGVVGAAAETHYSFMGATDPTLMESRARTMARRMKDEDTDAVLLVPI
ncbi:MAG TPA: glycine/sarcosine/betaine reductase selenoprotein B family protein [Polyangia bacterium]|jgi:D-proline reductase (dithiol) PrdB|nr:glycine/sarcosine/betaine reductase selenoprotein B family protein [Polyangia bacterium]